LTKINEQKATSRASRACRALENSRTFWNIFKISEIKMKTIFFLTKSAMLIPMVLLFSLEELLVIEIQQQERKKEHSRTSGTFLWNIFWFTTKELTPWSDCGLVRPS
jgi:hypothetical protein